MSWIVLDGVDSRRDRAATLAEVISDLHSGVSSVVQLPDRRADTQIAQMEALARQFDTTVVEWEEQDDPHWAGVDEALGAAARTGQPAMLVVRRLDRRAPTERARCIGLGVTSLRRLDRMAIALGPHDPAVLRTALTGVDDPRRPALLLLATFESQPLTGADERAPQPESVPQGSGADEWVGALQPVRALQAAVDGLDLAASLRPEDLAPALEALALAQALHRRDEAARAALTLAAGLGAPEEERALAAAQVRALQAVLRLDPTELRRGVADRHAALERARRTDVATGPGGVAMIDGVTGLAAVIGVVADAPARAPIGPVDATLLALADRLGPSAERTPLPAVGDDWSEVRKACATTWSALSRSELGIAWWHVALLACWPQARGAGWDETGDLLRAALAFFNGQGFDDLAAEARLALRTQGERVPRRGRGASTVPAVLARCGVTSREMDVLGELDDGVTNKDIAASLYLSPRTVGHHISSLLAKTGLERRRDLLALARELDQEARSPRMLR